MKTYDELLAERDALTATVRTLKMAIMSNCYDDPSTSGKRLMELANATPAQCLAEIKAEAGRAGYELGAMQWCFDSSVMGADIESSAIRYADKIRNAGTWLKDSNVNGGKRGGEK